MLLALRFARRELRLGVRGLRIALACLALGVATIAAVGGLRQGIETGLAADGATLLGGDLEIQGGAQPLPVALVDWLHARGAKLSAITRMRSLLSRRDGGDRLLVELKVVDQAWPLVGAVGLTPAQPIGTALAGQDGLPGLVAEQLVLDRLGVGPGAIVRLGDANFQIEAVLTNEPDRVTGSFTLGPHVLIGADALAATYLVQPGSLLNHDLRVVLPPGADPAAVRDALRAAFPNTGWRIRLASEGTPGVQRFIDQAALFMTLVGLGALLVGGVGVGMGVHGWLESRARTIAIFRCLGASGRMVFAIFLAEVLAIAAFGIAIGLAAGAALPAAGLYLFRDVLPAPPHIGLYPVPLLMAGLYGVLVALLFAIWPLGRAARIQGGALFREAVLPSRAWPGAAILAATCLLLAALVGLTLWQAPDRGLALGFCAAAASALVLFRLGGSLLVAGARRLPRPRLAWAKLGLSSLHAPGAPAALILVALGLGLAIMTTLGGVRASIAQEITDQLPADAPSFYFIDIQPDQVQRFVALLAGEPGVRSVTRQPSLRARIVALNGVPVDQVNASQESRWALEGDRGLTWSATPPAGTRLVAGEWWPADYAGPPLVSLDAALAHGWGIGLGSMVRLNVAGRDIDMKVASLRDVAWRSMSLNFTLVASPGLLSSAPQTAIAAVRVDPGQQATVLRAVSAALPNVTGIDIGQVLGTLATLLDRIAAGLAAVGSLALASGALVMAGAVAATQPRRVQDAVVLKVLGATSSQIRAAWLVEFAAVGLGAGVLAALVGQAAAWAVMRFALHADYDFQPGLAVAIIGGALSAAVVLGLLGSEAALREKPARRLRNP
jgi:putative ABC transport system permease protein